MNRTPSPSWPIDDRRAWTMDTVDATPSWFYPLPDECLAVLDRVVRDARRDGGPPTTLRLAAEQRAACAAGLKPVLTALETERGFAVLDRVPLEHQATWEAQALYWLIGQVLGQPFAQNVQGTLLYDVRDTGQDVRYGARFSVTNAESTFHTDNSFGHDVLDYVGLLCLKGARAGGLSQVISGYTVHDALRDEHPEVLAVLGQPFQFDRRGGVREGEAPTARLPVLQRDERGLTWRYLRYWIETGHDRAGIPLTRAQVEALDTLDRVLRRPELWVEFGLEPGQMFFLNNRWILHNRTAFEDHTEPGRRRHLVRLWLKRDS